jgi:hypothetical protein
VEVRPRVDAEPLPGQVLLDPGAPELAPEAGVMAAAERGLGVSDIVGVDPDVGDVEPPGEP